ncbi:putative quinol monooxygenase [Janibacter cremeus]|uniref:Quinol monooxygenase YgiN n=1 Tax=Janibacter cremeus TaxID=1285192 RepID=A0A852VQA8_9MICO|nr:putative quinol monooxygenase [Janibacter cremeus]NYF98099.1 quinol monooxygenase YgiN [Janibacter cremeus]
MILIVVKYRTKPEWTPKWPELVREFTEATRAEPGNIFFDWSKSVEDEHEWVLVEAFQDEAGEAHVTSDHFAEGLAAMKPALAETPRIISRVVDGSGWDEMGELQVD